MGTIHLMNDPAKLVPRLGVLVAHNAKFELMWLNRLGCDTTGLLVWDTMIAEYVLAGNRQWALDLGSVAARYGLPGKHPLCDALMAGGVCPSEMPRHLLEARCRRDVATTEAIFLAQKTKLAEAGLLPVMFTRCILTPVLAAIEAVGMSVDAAAVRKEFSRVAVGRANVETEINQLTGGINLRSTKQLGEFVYDTLGFTELVDRRGNVRRTPGNARLTDTESLDALTATTERHREFIRRRKEYGDFNARLTKTLDFLGAVCAKHGSHFHGTFHQTRTQTHRLSSSGRKIPISGSDGQTKERGIQFQNLPVEYKKLFTTLEPDYVMVEVDGAQLEFRVAAFLGQDPVAARDIVTGHDVHAYTASILTGRPMETITKKQRTAAKPDTFKPLYGGQSGTKAQVTYYEAFRRRYCKIEDTQKGWVHTVLREKELRTVTGLTFYWPDTRMESSGHIRNTASVYNYPIQSLATADIIPISLTFLYWRAMVSELRVKFTNTVHDSVTMECHKDDVAALRKLAEAAFLEDTYEYLDRVYGIKFNVPLGLGFTAGTHWGEGEEIKISRPNPAIPILGGQSK
jgi:DNA polymerase I-like protein with 3'-5' exonuclease and polymerase domains